MNNKKVLLPRPAPMMNMAIPGMMPLIPGIPMVMPSMQPFLVPRPVPMMMNGMQPVGLPFIVPRPAGMKMRPATETGSTVIAQQPSKKRPRLSDEERLERSRERNRIHARKTRQRKKAMLSNLQETVKELTEKGTRLRQTINERKTASILLMMAVPDMEIPDLPVPIEFNAGELSDCEEIGDSEIDVGSKTAANDEPDIEEEDDTCKGAELLLISRHGKAAKRQMGDLDLVSGPDSKRRKTSPVVEGAAADGAAAKDEPSAEDIEHVRRERNRMHAKRTRIRKKMLIEQTYKVIQRLEAQNKLLGEYVEKLEGGPAGATAATAATAATKTGEQNTENAGKDVSKERAEGELHVPALPVSGLAPLPMGSTLQQTASPLPFGEGAS